MSPNIGQGANLAIESAAALSNTLNRLLKDARTEKPTETEIKTALDAFTTNYFGRVRAINLVSQAVLRMHARDGCLMTIFGMIILRSRYLTEILVSSIIAGGVQLDYIPLAIQPKRGDQVKHALKLAAFLISSLLLYLFDINVVERL